LRIQDAQWNEAQNQPLPTIEHVLTNVVAELLLPGTGRPRTNAYVVYLFLTGRGFFGGFESAGATTLMLESGDTASAFGAPYNRFAYSYMKKGIISIIRGNFERA